MKNFFFIAAFFWATQAAGQDSNILDPLVYVAMGDSVTAGSNTTGLQLANYGHSFATGDGEVVEGHYYHLKQLFGDNVKFYNVAVPGGSVFWFKQQAKIVARLKPDYVTILLGANDICRWDMDYRGDSLPNFEQAVSASIEKIVTANPHVMIQIIPLPNMLLMRELGFEKKCYKLRDRLNICNELTHSEATKAELDNFRHRYLDANAALARVASRFTDNVMYDPQLTNIKFVADDISDVDCFHPSLSGQQKLAKYSWASGWFADYDENL